MRIDGVFACAHGHSTKDREEGEEGGTLAQGTHSPNTSHMQSEKGG